MGGPIYFNSALKVLKACAARPDKNGELSFGERMILDSSWTESLIKENRFQKVVDEDKRKLGALYFSWLNEHEVLGSTDRDNQNQNQVSVGGFVFLFSPTGESTDSCPSEDMPTIYFEVKGLAEDRDIILGMPSVAW